MTTTSIPDHLLSLQEWDDLPEDSFRWAELAKGVLEVNASPGGRHQVVLVNLLLQLAPAARVNDLFPIPDMDVLIDPVFPATIRQPDVSVVEKSAAKAAHKRLAADDVIVAIEIVSPGSGRRDRVIKLAEYAAAGIRHYWIVDLAGAAVRLEAFALDDGRYRKVHDAQGGTVTFEHPFPVAIDLDALLAS